MKDFLKKVSWPTVILCLIVSIFAVNFLLNETSAGIEARGVRERISIDAGEDAYLYNGADVIVYSDNHTTEVARIDGATGAITSSAGITVSGVVDLNGLELTLDADADTSLTADTDDQVDVEINGADDFRFVANIFRALSGSSIETNTINETTATNGVTVDGLLIKDLGWLLGTGGFADINGEADGLILDADADTTLSSPTDDQIDVEISGADDFTFTANLLTALSGSTIATNTIAETTAASGVTIDGLLVKDGGLTVLAGADVIAQNSTNSGLIFACENTVAFGDTANKTICVIPANANIVDITFWVSTAFDDSGTDLIACGTTSGDPDEYVDDLAGGTAGINRMGDAADMVIAMADVGASDITVLCKYTGQNANATAGAARLAILYTVD